MSIARVMVVDPTSKDMYNDVITYQVPENSRAWELLTQLLQTQGFEFVTITPYRRKDEA